MNTKQTNNKETNYKFKAGDKVYVTHDYLHIHPAFIYPQERRAMKIKRNATGIVKNIWLLENDSMPVYQVEFENANLIALADIPEVWLEKEEEHA